MLGHVEAIPVQSQTSP